MNEINYTSSSAEHRQTSVTDTVRAARGINSEGKTVTEEKTLFDVSDKTEKIPSDTPAPVQNNKRTSTKRARKTDGLTPDEEEQEYLSQLEKYEKKRIEISARLAETRTKKWRSDMEQIDKICSSKGYILSDLKGLFDFIPDNDALVLLKKELSERARQKKK